MPWNHIFLSRWFIKVSNTCADTGNTHEYCMLKSQWNLNETICKKMYDTNVTFVIFLQQVQNIWHCWYSAYCWHLLIYSVSHLYIKKRPTPFFIDDYKGFYLGSRVGVLCTKKFHHLLHTWFQIVIPENDKNVHNT